MSNRQTTSTKNSSRKWWFFLVNPDQFLSQTAPLIPLFALLALVVLSIGLYMVAHSPDDYQQGVTVRIMYLHVPFAWLSMFCYALMGVSAFGVIVWRHVLADIWIKCAAPLGATFTGLVLLTGSLWGRPTWGTWWEWDARLTSVFILFLIYLGTITLRHAFNEHKKAGIACAIFTLVGCINLPIIKFSVDWWNTLHQPASIFRWQGPSIDPTMLWPLMVMALGFTLLFITLQLISMGNEIRRRKIIQWQISFARKNRHQGSA
ncbi:heme ABC transporter permease [Bartonella sp. DGB2]|uniref:heme ABC transporter permease n=1 Tax=Bartonella sp. DGB2 TaxID=3388426 RepID=UPI00398F9C34